MEWVGEPNVGRGVVERRFDLDVDDDRVPGILWTPEDAKAPRPLVLIGHGGSQHKRAPNILALGRRLVRHCGFAAAAIDAPDHGERIDGGEGQTLDDVAARLRDRTAEQARATSRKARTEWMSTLDALQKLPEVGVGPVGYWGLSMGTVFGLPFVASEPRIDCAVLGLMGIAPGAEPRSASSITIPVLFLVQSHDELVPRENALALWDALGTDHKSLHLNPGIHVAVPAEEIHASIRFFDAHLSGKLLQSDASTTTRSSSA